MRRSPTELAPPYLGARSLKTRFVVDRREALLLKREASGAGAYTSALCPGGSTSRRLSEAFWAPWTRRLESGFRTNAGIDGSRSMPPVSERRRAKQSQAAPASPAETLGRHSYSSPVAASVGADAPANRDSAPSLCRCGVRESRNSPAEPGTGSEDPTPLRLRPPPDGTATRASPKGKDRNSTARRPSLTAETPATGSHRRAGRPRSSGRSTGRDRSRGRRRDFRMVPPGFRLRGLAPAKPAVRSAIRRFRVRFDSPAKPIRGQLAISGGRHLSVHNPGRIAQVAPLPSPELSTGALLRRSRTATPRRLLGAGRETAFGSR